MLVGIDLGTTNSAAALWVDGAAQLVPNALGALLTPSAVHIDAAGHATVGAAALDRMATDPDNSVASFKRFMGTAQTVRLGGRAYRPEELSALVLDSLCRDIAAQTGQRPTEAVITVPAYFNDRQRKATRRAAELIGLSVRRLINEPTAAALAFGLQDRGDREAFLVFDLGGGTFDVSIVEMFDGIVEVRASAGDNRLGGDDFNTALAAAVLPTLDPDKRLDSIPTARRSAMLTRAAEACRRALSENNEAPFTVTLSPTEQLTTTVSEAAFEEYCSTLLRRMREPVVRAMRDCGLDAAQLSEIVLVGGATRMPVVRRAITRMFGRFPNSNVHPDHAIALGAAIQAGLASRDAALEEVRITDVCPFSMGVEVADRDARGAIIGGLFSPIIERNTPVPVSRVQSYSTMADNQTVVRLHIYQGEAREVKRNIKLGELEVKVPPRPAGHVSVEVRFTYDSSGLLEVDTHLPDTGETKNLVIVDEEDRMSPDELEKRRRELASLKHHPRDDAENVALLARAARCYEDHIGDMRAIIGEWITGFEGALASQDPRRIVDARSALTQNLDAIDASAPL